MSESFINKPPPNPDDDTVYTMGGLDGIADFIGSAEQIAQLYPGEQNRPEYEPGLSDLRYTRSFQGAGGPGGSFYAPSGAGNAPAPFEEQIIYQQPFIQPGGQPSINEALLGALFGMDWTGAYEDYINKLESQRDITNFMPNFDYSPSFDPTFNPTYSPSNVFNPTYAPSTDISNVVSPSITQNPNITVSPEITNTLEQTQQQTMAGGSKTGGQFQDDSLDFDFDIGFPDSGSDGGGLDSDFFNVAGAGSGARTSNQDDQLFEADLGLPSTDFGATNYRSTVGLNTVSPVINQSPSIIVSPTISNVLKQQQAQWMGGDGGRRPTTSISVSVSQETSVDTSVTLSIPTTTTSVDTTVVTTVSATVTETFPTTVTTSIPTTISADTTVTLSIPTTTTLSVDTTAITTVSAIVSETFPTTVTASISVSVSTSVPVSLTASEEAVVNIYKGLFDREDVGDENLDYWSSKLDAGTPLETLIRQIAGGAQGEDLNRLTPNEAERYIERLAVDTPQEREAFITKAYQDLFNKAPDAEGRAYWTRELEQGKTPTELLRDMVAGAQGQDAARLRNNETIDNLYKQVLGREADPEGRDYYRSQLEAGATPEEIARNIESGARGADAAVVLERQATSKFQDTVRDAITKRENLKANIIQASLQGAPYEVLDQLVAAEQAIGNALQSYDVNRILNDPNYAREQVAQLKADALASLSDPNNPLSPEAVNDVLSKAVNTIGADEIAKSLSAPVARSILEKVGREVAGDVAGDLAGPVAAALVSLAQGGSAGTAITEGAKAYVVSALMASPGVGQVIGALIIADSFLSGLLGYESPLDSAMAGAAKNVDKAIEWIGERAIGSDPFGGVMDWASDTWGDVTDWWDNLFAEGGLVDLPGDSMYNANTQGVLPDIEGYARGGVIPLPGGGKIARGPGGGLDDLIPTSIDGRRAAALSDGEFVIPADVVSMMGDGSTNAGSKRLYDLVRQIRQEKTGTSRQAGPLQVGKILERTMK